MREEGGGAVGDACMPLCYSGSFGGGAMPPHTSGEGGGVKAGWGAGVGEVREGLGCPFWCFSVVVLSPASHRSAAASTCLVKLSLDLSRSVALSLSLSQRTRSRRGCRLAARPDRPADAPAIPVAH